MTPASISGNLDPVGLINLNFDTSALAGFANLGTEVEKAAKEAGDRLAQMAHGKAIELANQRLRSRRQMFIDNLTWYQENEDTWVVQLDASARWIDDGMCVVYGEADRHVPSVLTPDGWVKIVDVRPGMLVLNQLGKWTSVLKVHDHDLFDYCVEQVDEAASAALMVPLNKCDRHRGSGKRSKKPVIARCLSCGKTRKTTRFALTDGAGVPHCAACMKKKRLVSFMIDRQGFERKLVLTFEHPVSTPRGWVKAGELTPEDHVYVPAWGACQYCGSKVIFGGRWCDGSCFQSAYQRKLLSEGKHPSQDPGWKAKCYKALGANKVSSIEDVVARILQKTGASVGFWGDGNFDWIRQFPVSSSRDSLGRQKYYYLDFYCPALKMAIEVDGHFHFTTQGVELGKRRDGVLLSQGIRPVHVPVVQVRSGDFERVVLPALLANHLGEIEMVPVKPRGLRTIIPGKYTPFRRRWDITVEDGSSFVCQGVVVHNSPHNMLDDLLASPKAKRAADGSSYITIPFEHSGAPTAMTPAQRTLQDTVKAEFKKFGVPFAKIERNDAGEPRLGLLHSFDITSAPLKAFDGPGQGKGPVGQVRQGPTGIPFLKGIQVSQRMVEGKPKRFVTTFRVASSKHRDQGGRWDHPGLKPVRIFEDVLAWAKETWEQKIMPELAASLKASL